jgi:hypothetical protein
MDQYEIYNQTGGLISTTVYNRAVELYNEWDEYVTENFADNDDFDKNDYYEEDSNPSVDKVIEIIGEEFMWPKGHLYPEDVLGDDYTDEEDDCYDRMTDEEIREFVDKGIEQFEDTIKRDIK